MSATTATAFMQASGLTWPVQGAGTVVVVAAAAGAVNVAGARIEVIDGSPQGVIYAETRR